MKTKHIWIINGAWLALAAGAFAVGRMSIKPEGAANATNSTARVAAALPSLGGGAKESVEGTSSEENPQAWAERFRGADGQVTPDKMSLAMREALRDTDPARAMMRFALMLKDLTPENAPAAFKTVRETVTGWEAMQYLPMLNFTWGALDGEAALAAMSQLSGGEAWFANAATLSGFASKNPEAAKKWLDERSQGNAQGGGPGGGWGLERAYIAGLARNDLDAAVRYVQGLPQEQRAGQMEMLVEQKIKTGIIASADWALSLSDPAMKTSALDRVAQQYARQDVATAANWVKAYAGESFGRDAVGAVAHEYASRAPSDALQWATSLPGGEAQNEAYFRVFREWGRSDPTAASETLTTMPAGASKDQAISSFTRSIGRESPEDAIVWANTIGDATTRETAQIEVIQRWRQSDANAANQWAAANLSAEAQARAAQQPQWRWDGRR